MRFTINGQHFPDVNAVRTTARQAGWQVGTYAVTDNENLLDPVVFVIADDCAPHFATLYAECSE